MNCRFPVLPHNFQQVHSIDMFSLAPVRNVPGSLGDDELSMGPVDFGLIRG